MAIVFHSLRLGNRDLFTVEADGTGLARRLPALGDFAHAPRPCAVKAAVA